MESVRIDNQIIFHLQGLFDRIKQLSTLKGRLKELNFFAFEETGVNTWE